jgi:hypothetical protein
MTGSAGIRALLAVAAVSAALAGCGDDDDVGDPIPQAKVDRLVTELDVAQQHVQDQSCEEAATAVDQARATVDTLDEDGVGQDVQDALGDGVDNLSSLVDQECEPEEEVETTPETVPEATPEPEPTTPEPTTPEPEPEPEPTTPEPTTPAPVPEEEPDEDDGSGQFGPGGVPPGQAKKEEKVKD